SKDFSEPYYLAPDAIDAARAIMPAPIAATAAPPGTTPGLSTTLNSWWTDQLTGMNSNERWLSPDQLASRIPESIPTLGGYIGGPPPPDPVAELFDATFG